MRIFDIFKHQPDDVVPNGAEAAWADDSLFSLRENQKYNPDTLMGLKGQRVYMKMMEDEQVKSVVTFKRDAITARDFFFEFDDYQKKQISEAEAERRIEVFSGIISNMHGSFLDALNAIMTGMYNGLSLTEKIYMPIEVDGTAWVGINRLKQRPFATFHFHVDDHGNIRKVTQQVNSREQVINIGKFIHYVHNPEVDEHYGGSDLRSAHRAWFSKRMAITNHNIYLERMAGGLIIVQAKKGEIVTDGSPTYNAIVKVLKNIQTKTAILLPNVVELVIHYPKSSGKSEYIETVAMHDKGISKALLVPNLLGISEQGSTGSFAQSKTQLEAFMWTLDADSMRLAEVLQEQLFRELGDINFGDGIYPQFRFKDLGDERKFGVAKMWADLVSAGAVNATETDEAHIRRMLGIPEKAEDEEGATDGEGEGEDGKVKNVGTLEYPLDATVNERRIINGLKPIDGGDAIYKPSSEIPAIEIEQPEDKKNEPKPKATPEPKPANDDTGTTEDDEVVPAEPGNAGGNKPDDLKATSTITSLVFARAVKRVDFAVMDRKSTAIEQVSITKMTELLKGAAINMTSDIPLDSLTGDDVKALKVKASDKRKFKTAMIKTLREAWALGQDQASAEVLRATKESKFVATPLSEEAAEIFFEARASELSLSLTENMRKKLSVILFNGIKFNWTDADITNRIIQEISTMAATQVATAVRTTVFEAINEARFTYFNDPQLGDFVEALEYSAILDGRTTPICKHLDNKVYPKNSAEWQTYRPPNHFNCRSLLVAVTTFDTWKTSPEPKLEPLEGFG